MGPSVSRQTQASGTPDHWIDCFGTSVMVALRERLLIRTRERSRNRGGLNEGGGYPQGSPTMGFAASNSAAVSNSFSPFAAVALRASPNTPLGVNSLNDRHRLSAGVKLPIGPKASGILPLRTQSGNAASIIEVSASQA